MITPEALRSLMRHLESQVELADDGSVRFEVPDRDALLAADLEPEAVDGLLAAPWLEEMATDVIETREFCEPDATDEEVLGYARDVVTEYIRKRFAR
jgi:hypothetical protein